MSTHYEHCVRGSIFIKSMKIGHGVFIQRESKCRKRTVFQIECKDGLCEINNRSEREQHQRYFFNHT